MDHDFYRIQRQDVTESTNEDAKRAAEAGEAQGLVFHALRQTAGRGRQGRAWESPEGNLYVSVLLRPCCSAQEAGGYSFATALAVRDTIAAFLPEKNVALKWPNDVLLEEKKISGILLEASPSADGLIDWLVIGVGINVSFHPEAPLYPTTDLGAEGAAVSVEDVLQKFLERLYVWRGLLLGQGFELLREAWLNHAKKGPVTARLPSETVEGTFSGLDSQGNLMLLLADGRERRIAAGDVFFGECKKK